MKGAEKKIIGISLLVLAIVIAWAVVVNVYNKDSKSLTEINNNSSKLISQASTVSNSDNKGEASTSNENNQPSKSNDQGVPVLMYHSVSNNKSDTLTISKDSFQEQMKYLKDNNFSTLTLDKLNDFLLNNKPIPEKSVVLTFDDGYEDNYQNVYPILKEYGFKASIFVIASYVDTNKNYLTSAQLKEMQNSGIDIESGTNNNKKLALLKSEKQLKSLKTSKEFLENLLNKKINYVSYPFGSYNKDTLSDVEKAGYILGLSRDGKWTYKTDGAYKLSRVYIGPKHSIDDFKERISNPNYK